LSAESPAIVPVTLTTGVDVFASPLAGELAEDEPFVAGGAGSEAALDETLPKRPSRKMQRPAIDRHADRLCVGFRWDFSTQSLVRFIAQVERGSFNDRSTTAAESDVGPGS
jgi:hypothetical protein